MSQKSNHRTQHGWVGLILAIMLSVGAIQGAWAAPQFGAVHAARQAPDYPGLDDPDPAVRAETVLAIREAKDVDAVPALIARLEDPDQRVGLDVGRLWLSLRRATP